MEIHTSYGFIKYTTTHFCLRVYGFTNILDGSEIFLFVHSDGLVVLPSLPNRETNYKLALGLDHLCVNEPICDANFLHHIGRPVFIREVISNKNEKELRSEFLNLMKDKYT